MVFGVFFAALSALQQGQTTTPSAPLTLDQAVAIAQTNAFTIRIAQSNIEKARQNLSATRGGMGPRISTTESYTRLDKAQTTTIGSTSYVTQPIESTAVAASMSIPIDIAGNQRRQAQASEHQLAATVHTALGTANDVRQSVKRAYFQVLRSQGLVGVADAALTSARERAASDEKLFKGDQIARVDLQRTQALVAESESDLTSAKNSLVLAENDFNFALSRPIETPVLITDIKSLPEAPADAQPLVVAAQKERPEVKAYGESIKALERTRRATESSMNPSLSFSLNYSRSLGSISSLSWGTETTTGVLALSIPVFDSGVTRDHVKSARQDELQAQINLQQLQLRISNEVRTAIANLVSARALLDSANRQVTLAQEVHRLAVVRQEAGEGTYLEIVDAQTSLTKARNQAVGARYDYLTAYADLQHAIGTDKIPGAPGTPTTGGN